MSAGVVLVTGAASPMGRAVVRRLAFAGYQVAAADACHGSVSKVAEENTKVGGKVQAFQVDITRKDHRSELIEKVSSAVGHLNSLIVVPGQNDVRGQLVDTTAMQFESVFHQFVTVPFRIAQEALPALSNSSNANIVFFSSTTGFQPSVDLGAYSVASSAAIAMTKAVAQSASRQNVRVNSIVTGWVDGDGSSGLWDARGEGATEGQGKELSCHFSSTRALLRSQIRESMRHMVPLNRLGRPSDAASLVEFLISDRAKYITGENVVLSGGISVRY